MTETPRTNNQVNNPMMNNSVNNINNKELTNKDISEMNNEDLIKMMLVTVNSNSQTMQEMRSESQRQAIELSRHDRNIAYLLQRDEEIKLNERIETWQDNIIKKKVAKMIKAELGDDYKNKSKMQIAYGWTYSNLANFGYGSGCSTKLRQYEPILEALESGVVSISKAEVDARYRQIQKKKKENK